VVVVEEEELLMVLQTQRLAAVLAVEQAEAVGLV